MFNLVLVFEKVSENVWSATIKNGAGITMGTMFKKFLADARST